MTGDIAACVGVDSASATHYAYALDAQRTKLGHRRVYRREHRVRSYTEIGPLLPGVFWPRPTGSAATPRAPRRRDRVADVCDWRTGFARRRRHAPPHHRQLAPCVAVADHRAGQSGKTPGIGGRLPRAHRSSWSSRMPARLWKSLTRPMCCRPAAIVLSGSARS
jgi:hypothetical protein